MHKASRVLSPDEMLSGSGSHRKAFHHSFLSAGHRGSETSDMECVDCTSAWHHHSIYTLGSLESILFYSDLFHLKRCESCESSHFRRFVTDLPMLIYLIYYIIFIYT